MLGRARVEFTDIFQSNYPRIVRACFLILADAGTAEEVTQEAFTRLFLHWKKVSTYDNPGAWAQRVAVRLAIDRARRSRMLTRLPLVRREPTSSVDTHTSVQAAINALPPMQRAVVTLYYFEDKAIHEIASILACKEATARVHLHKARKRLASLLSEEETNDIAR
jgi:RNA polymerase sigma-70 factor, ECF subfamily